MMNNLSGRRRSIGLIKSFAPFSFLKQEKESNHGKSKKERTATFFLTQDSSTHGESRQNL
jgi:hypothetical protein